MSANAPRIYLAEPPAHYLVRPPVVVDCSVFAAFMFRETGKDEALARMFGKFLHAPFLLQIEMASVALKKYKLGFSEVVEQGLQHYEAADILYHPSNPTEVLKLSAQYQITAYDANYLWLAAQLKCPLLTFDEGLGKAAQVHLASLS